MDMSYQNRNQGNIQNIKESTPGEKKTGMVFLVILFFWIIMGFVAFITSIICFGKSGSTLEKIMGLLLAIFFGPFYFLFYAFNGNYCR
jgi:hypothetical protein